VVRLGQNEIFDFLKNQYLSGNKEHFSIRQISDKLKLHYPTTSKQVVRLYAWGYLDIKVKERWKREYRIKKKYIEIDEEPSSIFGRKDDREKR